MRQDIVDSGKAIALSNGEIQLSDAPDDYLRATPDECRNPALGDAGRASEAGPAREGASVNAELSQQFDAPPIERDRNLMEFGKGSAQLMLGLERSFLGTEDEPVEPGGKIP